MAFYGWQELMHWRVATVSLARIIERAGSSRRQSHDSRQLPAAQPINPAQKARWYWPQPSHTTWR